MLCTTDAHIVSKPTCEAIGTGAKCWARGLALVWTDNICLVEDGVIYTLAEGECDRKALQKHRGKTGFFDRIKHVFV